MTIGELIDELKELAYRHGHDLEAHVLVGAAWKEVTGVRFDVDGTRETEDEVRAVVIQMEAGS